jgi:hypothetical protein
MKRFKRLLCASFGHKHPDDSIFGEPCTRCGRKRPLREREEQGSKFPFLRRLVDENLGEK